MLIAAQLEKTHNRDRLGELLEAARDAGFAGVELTVDPSRADELLESEDQTREIARQADRYGVDVLSVALTDSPAAYLGNAEPPQDREILERLRSIIRHSAWLGARCLRLIPAIVGESSDSRHCFYQDALNRTCLNLERLRPELERRGVVGAVVPCHHGFLLSPPEFREMIDLVNSSAVGAALDVAACAAVGDPADWITTMQHRLVALVVNTPDLAAELSPALAEIRFGGLIVLTNPPDDPASVAALREAMEAESGE